MVEGGNSLGSSRHGLIGAARIHRRTAIAGRAAWEGCTEDEWVESPTPP
jgi:hypothetical protein